MQELPSVRFRAAKPPEDASAGLEGRALVAQKIAVELNERLSIMSRNQQLPTAETCELIIFDRWAAYPSLALIQNREQLGWACEARPRAQLHSASLLPAPVAERQAEVNILLIAQLLCAFAHALLPAQDGVGWPRWGDAAALVYIKTYLAAKVFRWL